MSTTRKLPSFFIVLLGPLLSLAILSFYAGSLRANEVLMIQFLLILVWSPLFFSIPSYIMQEVRDSALPHDKGVLRGIKLMGFLASRQNKDNHIFLASIVGWVGLVVVAHSSIGYVFNLLF